ncbi:MAG: hypothetical protein QOK21_1459 [Solirubrobacteraceae bacterium]|jgi:hypothetical protein|nr:hypothetical protein [Solirubrobacteraceae bacterium]
MTGSLPRRAGRVSVPGMESSGSHAASSLPGKTAALYLERATFVTGEILHIDGGRSAGH